MRNAGWKSGTVTTVIAAVAGAAVLVGATPAPALAAPGHVASGNVNADGSWTRGTIVRTAANSSTLDHMEFYASGLPGCCLDIRIREAYGAEYLRSEIYNIQSLGLYFTEQPTSGLGTPTTSFRIWSRNSIVGSDRSWAGTFYY
jgi:hypothetical protein